MRVLDPDWLRVGTDIVGRAAAGYPPTFNGVFSLSGSVGSRAFDLGHDAARLRGSRLRGLSKDTHGRLGRRLSQPGQRLTGGAAKAAALNAIKAAIAQSTLRRRSDSGKARHSAASSRSRLFEAR